MSFSLEQIDVLRERAKVSYEAAKEALERCNGDMVEALIYLERQNKCKSHTNMNSGSSSFMNTVKRLIKKGNETKFVIRKKETTVINVPVNVAILTTVFATPVTIVGVAVALLTNHSIKFEKSDGSDMEINKVLNNMSTAVTVAASQVVQTVNNATEPENKFN